MAIVDDFKDIASRMKGELAPKPQVVEEILPEPRTWRILCAACYGTGKEPSLRGGGCNDCLGKGYL